MNEQREGFVMTKAVDGGVQAAALNATDTIDLEVSPGVPGTPTRCQAARTRGRCGGRWG